MTPVAKMCCAAIVEQREGREQSPEATVKVAVDGEVLHTAADGNGPVNALDTALRKALSAFYPSSTRCTWWTTRCASSTARRRPPHGYGVVNQVRDFDAWKAVYDGFMPTAKTMGVLADAVYRTADDPAEVTVTHDFATLESAKAFGASDALHGAMETAGLAGPPSIWLTNKA